MVKSASLLTLRLFTSADANARDIQPNAMHDDVRALVRRNEMLALALDPHDPHAENARSECSSSSRMSTPPASRDGAPGAPDLFLCIALD
jgi:hypothetical protein